LLESKARAGNGSCYRSLRLADRNKSRKCPGPNAIDPGFSLRWV
jgi:hypothetical protein